MNRKQIPRIIVLALKQSKFIAEIIIFGSWKVSFVKSFSRRSYKDFTKRPKRMVGSRF